MTSHPILDQQRARGVETNGIGMITTSHLNLTADMRAQIMAEVLERLCHSAMKGRRTYRRRPVRVSIQGDPRIAS
jgi:hypothetical protein